MENAFSVEARYQLGGKKIASRCCMVLLLTIGLIIAGCNGESRQHLKALKQLAKEIPTAPGSRISRAPDDHKTGSAIVIQCYESTLSFDDVASFYRKTLPNDGWVLLREPGRGILHNAELIFQKGKYKIGIKRGTPHPGDCAYLIDFLWERD